MVSSRQHREALIGLGYGFWEPKVLLTAIKTGLFEFLHTLGKPADTAAIAGRFQGNERAWGLFCNALSAMGFLKKSSNIIHRLGDAENGDLMKKVFTVTNRGGMVMVKDFVMNTSLQRPRFGALFALNMLLFTMRGRSYSLAEIAGWLKHSGFRNIRRIFLPIGRDSAVVVGVKP